MNQTITPRNAARLAGSLFALSGALVLVVTPVLPLGPHGDARALALLGGTAIAAGAAIWVAPWDRWRPKANLWLVVLAFVLEALHNVFTGLDGYRFSPFFMLTFAWIGLCHRPGTAARFLPLLTVAYLTPLLLADERSAVAISSVVYIVPVSGMLGEAVAWVSERWRRAQAEVADGEASFRMLFAANPQPMWVYDVETLAFLEVNEAAEQQYGYSRDAFLHMTIKDIRPEEDVAAVVATVEHRTAPLDSSDWRHRRADGSLLHVHITSHLLAFNGRPACLVLANDVTETRRAEADLRASEERFRRAFDDAPTGTCIVDRGGRILRVNAALCTVVGEDDARLVGRSLVDLVHPEDAAALRARLRRAAAGARDDAYLDTRFRRSDGGLVWGELGLSPLHDSEGEVAHLLVQLRDVTERRAFEERLAHQALHDTLTGLPNRALLLDRLDLALRRTERSHEPVAVLFCDLDRFKLVNDGFGHDVGDRLLERVADRLQAAVRPGDTVARIGGDEFVILCEGLGPTEAVELGRRLEGALAPPVVLAGAEVFAAASIGVAISGPGASPAGMVRDADAAMYLAKDRGRGRVELFDEGLRAHAVARLETETALRRALERGGLEVHFQPEVSVTTGHVVAVETLVRWNHPERGLIGPGEFIAIAEDSGLIVPLGELVLEEGCRQAAAMAALGHPIVVSVNLSARQLSSPGFVEMVRRTMEATWCPPALLCLEVTESLLVEEQAEALHELKALGVTLALDDFGTGYSSLGYLRRFPLDVLKIDRSFVADLTSPSGDGAIVEAIVGLARGLGLQTVAEGVEDRAQATRLAALGVDVLQGYLFGRPAPAKHLLPLLGRDLRPMSTAAPVVPLRSTA